MEDRLCGDEVLLSSEPTIYGLGSRVDQALLAHSFGADSPQLAEPEERVSKARRAGPWVSQKLELERTALCAQWCRVCDHFERQQQILSDDPPEVV